MIFVQIYISINKKNGIIVFYFKKEDTHAVGEIDSLTLRIELFEINATFNFSIDEIEIL